MLVGSNNLIDNSREIACPSQRVLEGLLDHELHSSGGHRRGHLQHCRQCALYVLERFGPSALIIANTRTQYVAVSPLYDDELGLWCLAWRLLRMALQDSGNSTSGFLTVSDSTQLGAKS